MSSQSKSAAGAKAPNQKSPDELEVDCAIARDIISQYFAITAIELAAEKDSELPDTARIGTLEARLKELRQEKMQLSAGNANLIGKAFDTYVKALKEAEI